MLCFIFFFFNDTATTEIYTLSLHDALPISFVTITGLLGFQVCNLTTGQVVYTVDLTTMGWTEDNMRERVRIGPEPRRSEEHTSELQSPCNLVCRLLLEKKKNKNDVRGVRPV